MRRSRYCLASTPAARNWAPEPRAVIRPSSWSRAAPALRSVFSPQSPVHAERDRVPGALGLGDGVGVGEVGAYLAACDA